MPSTKTGASGHSSQNSCLSFSCPTAANQKEALKGTFCVKEEPQAEEPLSSQRGPSYTFCQEGPPGSTKPREEGSPMLGKSSLLSQDINVKVASELLMKLSGQQMYFSACTHVCVFSGLNSEDSRGLSEWVGVCERDVCALHSVSLFLDTLLRSYVEDP